MKSNYICNCSHYDFSNKEYKYWENRNVTSDEIIIVKYIKSLNLRSNLNILHVGVGNSYIYEQLNKSHIISGITISNQEIKKSKKYRDKKYEVLYCDKLSNNLNNLFQNKKFDIIIDNNLKSYSCCNKAFNYMFQNFVNLLNIGGSIITTRLGMNWVKKIKPKLSFNFKDLLHYKLKEFEGDKNNIFTVHEAEMLSKKFSLKINKNENIISFLK